MFHILTHMFRPLQKFCKPCIRSSIKKRFYSTAHKRKNININDFGYALLLNNRQIDKIYMYASHLLSPEQHIKVEITYWNDGKTVTVSYIDNNLSNVFAKISEDLKKGSS